MQGAEARDLKKKSVIHNVYDDMIFLWQKWFELLSTCMLFNLVDILLWIIRHKYYSISALYVFTLHVIPKVLFWQIQAEGTTDKRVYLK